MFPAELISTHFLALTALPRALLGFPDHLGLIVCRKLSDKLPKLFCLVRAHLSPSIIASAILNAPMRSFFRFSPSNSTCSPRFWIMLCIASPAYHCRRVIFGAVMGGINHWPYPYLFVGAFLGMCKRLPLIIKVITTVSTIPSCNCFFHCVFLLFVVYLNKKPPPGNTQQKPGGSGTNFIPTVRP